MKLLSWEPQRGYQISVTIAKSFCLRYPMKLLSPGATAGIPALSYHDQIVLFAVPDEVAITASRSGDASSLHHGQIVLFTAPEEVVITGCCSGDASSLHHGQIVLFTAPDEVLIKGSRSGDTCS